MNTIYYYKEDIVNSINLKEAFEYYGFKVNKQGFANCCFHNEKSNSLKIYDDNHYHCFGCNAHGNVIDLVRYLNKCGYIEALNILNDDFHLCLPLDNKPTLSKVIKSKNKAFCEKQSKILEESQKERLFNEYLDKMKLYTDFEELIEQLRPKAGEMPSEVFFEAIKRKEYIGYLLDECEVKIHFNDRY